MGRCISQGREEVSLAGLAVKGVSGTKLEMETRPGLYAKDLGGQIHGWAVTKGLGDSGPPLLVDAGRQPVEPVGQGLSNFLTKTHHKKYILHQKPLHTYTHAQN